MANLPWLDEVLTRLAKRGLPPNYVQRLAGELSDHIEDFKEENMSTEAVAYSRLGKPEQVVDAAVAAYRRRSFLGRHPTAAFLVFGVSPVLTMLALFFFTVFGAWAIVSTLNFVGVNVNFRPSQVGPFKATLLCWVESLLAVVIPSIIASILYCKLARRLGISRKWMVAPCAVLAAIALVPGFYWTNDFWCLGLLGLSSPLQLQHLVQLIGPIVTCWLFMRRIANSGRLQLAS